MYSKLIIKGNIEVQTGMHIGGSEEFSAIGAIDSPVIKDALSRLPILPGSSLKGKMRTLLARKYNKNIRTEHSEDAECIKNLFGSADKSKAMPSRLIFTDSILANQKEILAKGAISVTEVKFENAINRQTGVANPRQIERAIKGSVFPLEIIYNVDDENEIVSDFNLIAESLRMLEYDYIGGSGSRGYGKVKFTNLDVALLFGDTDSTVIDQCKLALKGVE